MDCIEETLRFVNAERKYRSIGEPLDELPRGRRDAGEGCPVALAFAPADVLVSGSGIFFVGPTSEPGNLLPPEPVQQFIDAFDKGELPQYDEDAA